MNVKPVNFEEPLTETSNPHKDAANVEEFSTQWRCGGLVFRPSLGEQRPWEKRVRENMDRNKRGVDPKGEIGKTKPQLQLIPPSFNLEVAAALNDGAKKYGPWNWRRDRVKTMTYIGAIRRHLDKFLDGENLDESGVTHLGHIAASCAILLDAKKHGMLEDDRPHVTPVTPLQYQSEEAIKRFIDRSFSGITDPRVPSDGQCQPGFPNGIGSL